MRGARFEARRDTDQRAAASEWDDNLFLGAREFNGLKVLMPLLGDYDIRPENNHLFAVRNERGGTEARYVVYDGAATEGSVAAIRGRTDRLAALPPTLAREASTGR